MVAQTYPIPFIQIGRRAPLKNPLEVMAAADDPLPCVKHDLHDRVFVCSFVEAATSHWLLPEVALALDLPHLHPNKFFHLA
jgi:hypothetical protein